MDLQTYCVEHGGTALRGCPVLAKLADDASCSAETLYMVAKGHKTPGPMLARAIDEASGGQVSRTELRPDIFGDQPTVQPAQSATIGAARTEA